MTLTLPLRRPPRSAPQRAAVLGTRFDAACTITGYATGVEPVSTILEPRCKPRCRGVEVHKASAHGVWAGSSVLSLSSHLTILRCRRSRSAGAPQERGSPPLCHTRVDGPSRRATLTGELSQCTARNRIERCEQEMLQILLERSRHYSEMGAPNGTIGKPYRVWC